MRHHITALLTERHNRESYFHLLPNDVTAHCIQPLLQAEHNEYMTTLGKLYDTLSIDRVLQLPNSEDVLEYIQTRLDDPERTKTLASSMKSCYENKSTAAAHDMILVIYAKLVCRRLYSTCYFSVWSLINHPRTPAIFPKLLDMWPEVLPPSTPHYRMLFAIQYTIQAGYAFLLNYYDITSFAPETHVCELQIAGNNMYLRTNMLETIAKFLTIGNNTEAICTLQWLVKNNLLTNLTANHCEQIWDRIIYNIRTPVNLDNIKYVYMCNLLPMTDETKRSLFRRIAHDYNTHEALFLCQQFLANTQLQPCTPTNTLLQKIRETVPLNDYQLSIIANAIQEHDKAALKQLHYLLE